MAALADLMSVAGSPHVAPMPSSLISRLRRSTASASARRSPTLIAAAASSCSVFRRLRSGPAGEPSSPSGRHAQQLLSRLLSCAERLRGCSWGSACCQPCIGPGPLTACWQRAAHGAERDWIPLEEGVLLT